MRKRKSCKNPFRGVSQHAYRRLNYERRNPRQDQKEDRNVLLGGEVRFCTQVEGKGEKRLETTPPAGTQVKGKVKEEGVSKGKLGGKPGRNEGGRGELFVQKSQRFEGQELRQCLAFKINTITERSLGKGDRENQVAGKHFLQAPSVVRNFQHGKDQKRGKDSGMSKKGILEKPTNAQESQEKNQFLIGDRKKISRRSEKGKGSWRRRGRRRAFGFRRERHFYQRGERSLLANKGKKRLREGGGFWEGSSSLGNGQ